MCASFQFLDNGPFFEIRLVIKIRKQPYHGQLIGNSVPAPAVLQISHDHVTQSNHELNQLKLGQVLLPSGPLTRIECRLAVVEIQKHVNDGVQSQWYRDGRPIAVNGSVFTQHQNGRMVVNLRGNKFKKIIFHFTTFENQASANERLLFAQFNHKKIQ